MQGNLANGTEKLLDWTSIDWKKVNKQVRNLRQRIFRATRDGDWKKVRSLQKLMLRSHANVLESVRRVTQINQGKKTPGVDKVVVKTPAERMKLVNEITTYTPWRAKPVKRVNIPKANGKLRPLGIPVVRDRALQAIVKNALEPEWEARFEETSYGFRPGRSTHDAIAKIFNFAIPQGKMKWIVDADIKGAFDNINHDYLLKTIGRVPGIELIHQWLKAGCVDDNTFQQTEQGTPQGGVISPLLANIALHGMEEAVGVIRRKKGSKYSSIGDRMVVRYADDFVVFCMSKEDAERTVQTLQEWLSVRGLQLSEEKTQIVHISEGFDFLGYNVRQYGVKNQTKSGMKLLIKPSKKSVQRIVKRLRTEWLSLRGHDVKTVLIRLNPIIRGWANYYRNSVAKRTFNNLDDYMFTREVRYTKHTHGRKSQAWRNKKYFGKLHPAREDKLVFGDKITGYYLLKFSWFPIERHVLVAGTNSPDDPSLHEYWQQRNLKKISNLKPNERKLARRQAGRCPICGGSLFIDEDIEQHHIVARKDGGTNGDNDNNLLLVHYYCHQQLTARQRREWAYE